MQKRDGMRSQVSQSIHEAGYRRFRRAMQDGSLQPGMIVTQNKLCAILGLSLTPLRETLVLLEEFGLVEVKSRAGIRIVYPEIKFISENYQFRSVIELHAIRVFAPVARRDWLRHTREKHEQIHRELGHGDLHAETEQAFSNLDSELHETFVRSLENEAIAAVYERIMDNISLARRVHDRTAARKRIIDSTLEHLAIIESLEKGDADGAATNLELHFKAATYRTIVAA
ncbi:MAG: GntR family transcriptional regulator [Hyphomicrobiales bacterium]|nr:GntR family transcriptional regulator [Hyphomicrobiales bacterium]